MKDTALVFPFILIIYILIELLERGTNITKSRKTLQGPLAPLLGAATGIVPQCGFSVMAAKLYENGLIRTGTIIAVFLATSDEALVILLANSPTNSLAAQAILPLILVKLIVAIAAGYLINFLLPDKATEATPMTSDGCEHSAYSCGREHEGKSAFRIYFVDPLIHSLKITAYILIVNLVLGFIIAAVGEDKIASGIVGGIYVEPFITAAIGLIPNCAASVIISQLYLDGVIGAGAMMSGLLVSAGAGVLVLFEENRSPKSNALILAVLYGLGVAWGLLMEISGVVF